MVDGEGGRMTLITVDLCSLDQTLDQIENNILTVILHVFKVRESNGARADTDKT